jgi:hypothetical protein
MFGQVVHEKGNPHRLPFSLLSNGQLSPFVLSQISVHPSYRFSANTVERVLSKTMLS